MAVEPSGGVRSTASVGGHPIHPMGVPLPITFLITLPLSDVAFLVTGDLFWPRVSWWLAVLGVLTGLGAALVGLVDFLTVRRVREHRDGWLHAGFNVLAVLLTFGNIYLRGTDPAMGILPWGILLSAAAALCVTVAGWFGGELVYRHQIGVTGH